MRGTTPAPSALARPALTATLAVALTAVPLAAQGIEDLVPGDRVRVTVGERTLVGNLLERPAPWGLRLAVGPDTLSVEYPVNAIERRVYRSQRERMLASGGIGLLVGAGVGVAIGASIGGDEDDGTTVLGAFSERGGGIAIACAAGGAALGTLHALSQPADQWQDVSLVPRMAWLPDAAGRPSPAVGVGVSIRVGGPG